MTKAIVYARVSSKERERKGNTMDCRLCEVER